MAPPEILALPHGAAVAGWDCITLELSAGAAGLRVLQVVLDGTRRPIAASDHVLFRRERERPSDRAEIREESIGGRFEPDGSFRGTCWLVTGPEPVGGEDPQWEMTPRQPSATEAGALRGLVSELLGRLG